jgi:flagellar FliL protein
MAEQDAAVPEATAPAVKAKRGGLGLILVAVLVSVMASGGVAYSLHRQTLAALKGETAEDAGGEGAATAAAPEPPSKPAQYVSLDPAFIVNLDAGPEQRFLQVSVDVMGRNPKTLQQVTAHAPQIRSRLLMLMGQQAPAQLATREGKEALQGAVLDEIKAILLAETGAAEVEAVFFSTFVMQ